MPTLSIRHRLVLLVGSMLAAQSLQAQTNLADYTVDLSMPTTPAAVHVGLSADDVIQPKNRRAFQAGLSQLFAGGGRPVGSIEVSPYYLLHPAQLSYRRYRDDPLFRAWTKTTVGYASGDRKIGEVEASARGYSLSTVVLDLSDPMHSSALQMCIDKMQAQVLAAASPGSEDAQAVKPGDKLKVTVKASDDDLSVLGNKLYKACLNQHRSAAKLWNRSRVAFGVAGGNGQEKAGAKRHIHYGTSWWLSAQYGFEGLAMLLRGWGGGPIDCVDAPVDGKTCQTLRESGELERSMMLTAHVRTTRRASDLDLTRDGPLTTQNSSLAGLRLTYGRESLNVFAEVSRRSLKTSSGNESIRQHAFGASYKLNDNLWLNAASGRRKQYVNEKLDTVTSLNLQFGAASEPLVKAPF